MWWAEVVWRVEGTAERRLAGIPAAPAVAAAEKGPGCAAARGGHGTPHALFL